MPEPLNPEDRRIPCLPKVIFNRRETNDTDIPLLLTFKSVPGAIRNLLQNLI